MFRLWIGIVRTAIALAARRGLTNRGAVCRSGRGTHAALIGPSAMSTATTEASDRDGGIVGVGCGSIERSAGQARARSHPSQGLRTARAVECSRPGVGETYSGPATLGSG